VDEIIGMASIGTRPPDSISAHEYATRMGVCEMTAFRRMNELEQQGVLKSAIVFDPECRHRIRVWWKVK
jgi:predicted ArsR family transcriptional regulator